MCWKPCGKRLNSGGCITASCVANFRAASPDTLAALRRVIAVHAQIEHRELDLPHHLQAGLERARAEHALELGLGSGSPRLHVRESGQHFRAPAKFSMNWLGSSTASHSTPLMPASSDSRRA